MYDGKCVVSINPLFLFQGDIGPPGPDGEDGGVMGAGDPGDAGPKGPSGPKGPPVSSFTIRAYAQSGRAVILPEPEGLENVHGAISHFMLIELVELW